MQTPYSEPGKVMPLRPEGSAQQASVTGKPPRDVNDELRKLGDNMLRISRSLHGHVQKLEIAVEGTYAGESGDPRVQLLGDALRVCRTADIELGRLNQSALRTVAALQEELASSSQAMVIAAMPPNQAGAAIIEVTASFARERDALNDSILTLERKRSELETLYEIARMLSSTLKFDEVLRLVLDQVISVVNAERGFLVLIDPTTGELNVQIAREKRARTIDASVFDYQISRGTVERVVRSKQPVVTSDDAQIELKEQESVLMHGIRSIMCAPLIVRDTCIGAVYVDSRIIANLFEPRQGDLLMAFCRQAAIAIGV